MKIRLDYVSNSSSSSFVIHLDRRIHEYTKEEFKELFFSNRALDIIYKRLKEENSPDDSNRNVRIEIDYGTCAHAIELLFNESKYNNRVSVKRL